MRVVPATTPAADVLALEARRRLPLERPRRSRRGRRRARRTSPQLLGKVPIFGICLGHQILGLALGGTTYKLKFGHHGGNQPVKDLTTGKVEITVAEPRLRRRRRTRCPASAERHAREPERPDRRGPRAREGQPLFSVQYHPEASPGPHDARLPLPALRRPDGANALTCRSVPTSRPSCSSAPARSSSARRASSTTRARRPARRSREEGYRVILVNSNPATIMTDPGVRRPHLHRAAHGRRARAASSRAERPDALLPTLGGQTGLNLALALAEAGVLEQLRRRADRRQASTRSRRPRTASSSRRRCERSASTCRAAAYAHTHRRGRGASGARSACRSIIRPSLTLGGTGGGIATTPTRSSTAIVAAASTRRRSTRS